MFNRLAVIGFDAQLDGLDNVDRVATAFYKGNAYSSDVKQMQGYSYAELMARSAQQVLQANRLTGRQVALIIVSNTEVTGQGSYLSRDRVTRFADALTLSRELINRQDSAVLIVAANLYDGSSKQVQPTFSFDQEFKEYGQNSGVACVLLSSEHFALQHHNYIYSYLNSFVVTDNLSRIEQSIEQSFAESVISSEDISSIEVSACADPALLTLEENGLLNAYRNDLTLLSSLSCIKSVVGENGPLSELLGFLNVVFALYLRYRPAVQGWSAPQDELLADWLQSPFYLLNSCAPVFPNRDDSPRYMAYSCLAADSYAHIILQENDDNQVHRNGYNANSDLSLFILSGDIQAELIVQLKELDSALNNNDIKTLAKECYQNSLHRGDAKFRAVLLAESAQQLAKEIALALTGIADAFVDCKDWKTPQGSYFCVNPCADPKTCFLYPGIGATYLGLGQDLMYLFPQTYPGVQKLLNDSNGRLKAELLTPRSVTRLGFKELQQHDLALRSNLADIAECGVGYACVFTQIFSDILNIKADFAAGYSMGEVSMFAALNCWKNPGQMSARLSDSQTFNERLSGELKTVRALWALPTVAEGGEKQVWESYNIKGRVEEVEDAIGEDERVYITLINTPDSLVIAGYPADCLAVAKRLGVRAIALNVHNAIHCEVACQHYQQMIELYSMELAERISTKLYSSSCYLPVPFSKKAISVSIAKCLCEQVDFPRLINAQVEQGASLFIEMGAGRSLCTWTDKILAENSTQESCMTVAVNAKGSDQQQMIMRAIAKLLSFGVKINLKSFFDGSIIVQKN